MRSAPLTFALAALVLVATFADASEEGKGDFETALRNESTSPSYVLVTIDDGSSRREACIAAPFLLGAIHKEFRIPYSSAGNAEALRRALSAQGRAFHFRSPAAIKNVTPRYSENTLREVQERIANVPTEQLRKAVAAECRATEKRDACAHILLKKGLPCRIADRSGSLLVEWSRLTGR